MAKARYILTKFWSDNFIVKLEPLDRYLFLYFLTNEHTNICGIYELPLRTMAFETGIHEEMLPVMIKRLDGKIYYIDGWVYVVNFMKNQLVNKNVKIGIENALGDIPKSVLSKFKGLKKMMSEGLFTNININKDKDIDIDINTHRPSKPPQTSPMAFEMPSQETDGKFTDTRNKNQETINKLVEAGEFKKPEYKVEDGVYDWRYLISEGKRLNSVKYIVALFWKEKQGYERLRDQYGCSYVFKTKDKCISVLTKDSKSGGTELANCIEFSELPKLIEIVDDSAWDDKQKRYVYEWQISTLVKNIQRIDG
jgi:hypothetical protein